VEANLLESCGKGVILALTRATRGAKESKKGTFTGMIGPDGGYQIENIPAGQVKIAVMASRPAYNPMDPFGLTAKRLKEEDVAKMKKQVPSEVDEKGLKQMMGMPAAEPNKPTPLPPKTEPFPTKYGDPEKSGLTYTVVGGSQAHDINLD
jgi:hypothetical protein